MARNAVYITIAESTESVSKLQVNIMLLVDVWVKKNPRRPIPRKEIIEKMAKKGKSRDQVEHALSLLLRLGYIRKAFSISNKTSYVQLRRV